ncbi:hypothetical protein Pmani_039306 [Petrolisthes manimaculis]|uniref:Uncharacterized protein n=1 Tax=Petrolisthes manimaculis TaxID=1843537 RepID=A0AAE1NEE8_9EUCA|nr:hypothetical protein Pmani_039306 [Petrolisthes manimaculis]
MNPSRLHIHHQKQHRSERPLVPENSPAKLDSTPYTTITNKPPAQKVITRLVMSLTISQKPISDQFV